MAEHTGILKDFGGGLRMRRGTCADAEALSAFNAPILGDDPFDAECVAAWTRDLICRPYPAVSAGDFTLVEDTGTGAIVSSLCTISQTWTYEGIPFGVGRPELVGTDPAYRNRGLVRAQFDVIHEWSRERGEMVQVITGIPYYYRQFGYEMGLELGGGRMGFEPHVPQLPEGQEEPYTFRRPTEADLPFLMKMYERESSRSMINAVREEADWRCELFEKSARNVNRVEVRVIEDRQGHPVGYMAHPFMTFDNRMSAYRYQLDAGVSYLAVTPALIRYLWKTGQELAPQRDQTMKVFGFGFGTEHPAYQAMSKRLVVQRAPYAYYVRVADLPAFLRRIAPALEKRLEESPCAGHTGELKISFYRDGLRLCLENGKLTTIESWKPQVKADEGNAAFPGLSFLQLVFGFRSLDEVQRAFPDCSASDDVRVVLEALFPRKPSSVWGVS